MTQSNTKHMTPDEYDVQIAQKPVQSATLILPTESYGNLTVQIGGISTLGEAIELQDRLKYVAIKKLYECPHFFVKTLTAKTGIEYQECANCRQLRFQNKDKKWSDWQMPKNSGGGK